MNKTRHYMRILLLVLLLGGMGNEAWAATKNVTYHVITLPYGEEYTTGKTGDNVNKYRIEAIKITVTCNDTDPIILPELIRSPLMTTEAYSYYTDVDITSLKPIFLNNGSKYDTFSFDGKTPLAANAKVAVLGEGTDVYVTYDKWLNKETIEGKETYPYRTPYGKDLALDGSKIYNIELSSNTGSGSWLYALNLDVSRGNRLQAIPYSDIYDDADLGSEGVVKIKKDNAPFNNEERRNYNFTWKFLNDDPYNIILETAYTGDYTYYEEVGSRKYWKHTERARFYTKLDSKTAVNKNPWLSNEWRYAWASPTKEEVDNKRIDRSGWFRNEHTNSAAFGTSENIIPTTNIVPDKLLFSFSLLGHSSGNNYTLVASWVNVNGNDWVPGTDNSNKGQYLHMLHTPEKYPGPAFKSFSNADQVQIHEVRDYTFKVKTPLSKTVLEVPVKWSDYAKESSLKDHYPTALKRKYTQITGAYREEGLTTEMATFKDVFENDEPFVNKNRDIWLEYKVLPSIPFKISGTNATFGDLKWYNIYLNKEDKYTVWYADGKFNTVDGTSGHSKYGHDSHFAFIGDPYELYVVCRKASENEDDKFDTFDTFRYLKLGSTEADLLDVGEFNGFNAVPNGTTLTAGNIYYTSETGGGKFIALGTETATGSNYYQKTYTAVADGTSLTPGSTYYTSSSGGGMFKAGSSTVVAGENQYYVRTFSSIPITENLEAGKIYYTSAVGEGRFKALGTENTNKTNYYREVYVKVLAGTTLTPGCVYYSSAEGDGPFVASYTGTANGSNFFTKSFQAVSNGTTLTAGGIYYKDLDEDGIFDGDEQFIAKGDEVATGSNFYDEANVWEIVYDDDSGDYNDCFRLRKFYSYNHPITIGWSKSENRPLNGDGSNNSSDEAKLKVWEVPTMTYTYYVVDKNNRIAVMATADQFTGSALNYESIPENIRSPFLALGDVDRLSFYGYASTTKPALTETENIGMTVNLSNTTYFTPITNTNSKEGSANEYLNHIFVKYDTGKLSAMKEPNGVPLKDSDAEGYSFNVLLFNEYIYYDASETKIKSKAGFTTEDPPSAVKNQWVLGGEDPYAMIIRNKGAGLKDEGTDKYVKVTDWAEGSITWVSDPSKATRFILKSSTSSGAYEVMATTGVALDGDKKIDVANSVDADKTFYNIGRTDQTTVKMYVSQTYGHGYAQIRFQLKKLTASPVIYHLVDRSQKELLRETARHIAGEKPQIPVEIFSPLVGYENYTYWKSASTDGTTQIVTFDIENQYGANEVFPEPVPTDVWITYEANDLVDMNHTTMYLLKYEQGDRFRQEDGSDGLLPKPAKAENAMTEEEKSAYIKKYQAVYPYCNGDGNFFVYGQQQYEEQQEGAASTRTRWAWYIESGNHDPYHVKILSRQTETYDGLERSAYFATRTFSDYNDGKTLVTALVWPNISGVQATEYMVLGSVGQYQLVTTPTDNDGNKSYLDPGEDPRHVVNSFENYWKTYDTVKKKLLKDLLDYCEEKEKTDRPDGSIEVPTTPTSLRERLTKKITDGGEYEYHSYQKMAKAKRWNGYNAAGEKSKGWETREHWFQTVNMGSGYFDLIPTTIDPALILLDQHGWEIMRKPLPSGPDDPNKAKKYEVLRQYDSPMVKEYIFWASASKRSGFHQYYKLDKRIGGSDFISTSLTKLPDWESENVKDNKGNHVDEYVTYIVKEEYAQSYNPVTKTGSEFLIRQGDKLANNIGVTTIDPIDVSASVYPGGVSQYIIQNIYSLTSSLWYVKPNIYIDTEMGYTSSNHDWAAANPNAYDADSPFANARVADLVTNTAAYKALGSDDKKAMITKYGQFTFSNGFDPYNIQISSYTDSKYFKLHMTYSSVSEGALIGEYDATKGGSKNVTLESNSATVSGTGYDNSKWEMTNQTLMAVAGADGNMQLMPRFDHSLRMRNFETLVTPTAEAADPDKLKDTYTQLYRPYVYNYRIIDNEGHESLRYQSGGELVPQTPDHFKSPLAKNFKYYKAAVYDSGTKVYAINESTGSVTSPDEITESLVGSGLSAPVSSTNPVDRCNPIYVRYDYDEEADVFYALQGKWLTMQLNEKDALYDGGIKQGTKPAISPTDLLKDAPAWHWKFLKSPYTAPDPYAVQMFNRSTKTSSMTPDENPPLRTPNSSLDGGTVGTTGDGYQHFALLRHEDGYYALAVARTESHANYYFLNGGSMTTEVAAITAKETGFTSTAGSYDGTKSQIRFTDDIHNTFTYHVFTNGTGAAVYDGVEAISDTQNQNEAENNGFEPKLPEAIKTPLLNYDQFIYYETKDDIGNSSRELKKLYGLYEGDVYVRYEPYDPSVSEYKVPNDRNEPGNSDNHEDPVAKGSKSNDAPLRLDNVLPHNIIWYEDKMMKANGASIESDDDKELINDVAHSWTFEGDDPYAIKIRHKSTNTYVHEATAPNTELSATATTFMLLNRDEYDYGVFAVTGHKEKMLTGHGHQLTTTDTAPTKFIIFTLGTLKVIYHLVIANIGQHEDIPYRYRATGEITDPKYSTAAADKWNEVDGGYTDDWENTDRRSQDGTSKRDLVSKQNQSTGVAGDKYQLGDTDPFYPTLSVVGDADKQRVSQTYCKDVGPISLGDALTVPEEFYRPNVNYFFVVHDIGDMGKDESSNDIWVGDATLNKKYKGLQITSKEMSLKEDLIGKTIYINIIYSFNTDIEANSGDNFVLSLDENKWYTLETVINNKPYLAQYTNAWGFELKEGRGSHYTNDFLWSPIGDPYGFRLFNRYMDVNSGDDNLGEHNRVIFSRHFLNNVASPSDDPPHDDYAGSSPDIHTDGQQILMGQYVAPNSKLVVVGKPGGPITAYPYETVATNSIYELLADNNTTSGYFHFHPVANTSDQTQVYFNPAWADDDGDKTNNLLVRLNPTAAEFTFGLSPELMKPYFDRAGYVGGLRKEIYNAPANAALVSAMKADEPVLSFEQLQAAQKLVYNMENTVAFKTGYYRLHSPLGISGIDPVRYVSGYTHKIETGYTDDDNVTHPAIPMHFYEKNSNEVRQFTDFKEGGFTSSHATRGDITIPPVEKDPASIFYFEKIYDQDRYNLSYMSTQGLYVRGTVKKGDSETDHSYFEGKADRAAAVMTTNVLPAKPWEANDTRIYAPAVDAPLPLFVMDLGGGVLLIHDQKTESGRKDLKYLSFDYNNDKTDNPTIYDMKMTHNTHTDHAKFCMQPVQDTKTQGINEMALKLDLKQDRRNDKYYVSFCAPFDVLLTDADNDLAYICKVWDSEMIHLKKIGKYNTGKYKGNNQFVPAGTPVIISSTKNSVTLVLPEPEPSKPITENIFKGEYLEQLLASSGALDVYTFGYPMTAKSVTTTPSTGVITFDQQLKAESNMGFYINATPNRESAADMGSWIRNNRYVYGNKIYYRTSGSGARQGNIETMPDFIPVVFDDDNEEEDEPIGESLLQRPHDNRVYDLLGRCVATGEEVVNGTWRHKVASGIYILNGRKIYVK